MFVGRDDAAKRARPHYGAEVVGFTGVSGARQTVAGCNDRRYTPGFSGESGRQFFRQVRGTGIRGGSATCWPVKPCLDQK